MEKSKTTIHNFSLKETREKAKYRLWLVYEDNTWQQRKYGHQPQILYGYYRKSNFGLDNLKVFFNKNAECIKKAIIYNCTNNNIEEILK